MHVAGQEMDRLYGKIYKLNDRLLQRSGKEPLKDLKYPCEEIFDFYITSHALNYLRNLYFNNAHDVSLCLSARCIIEGIALKTMCRNGTIGDLNKELLQKQVFLIEYNQYKDFMDISEGILLPEKLQKDWQDACNFYREKLASNFAEKEIKQILRSNIPFLCRPNISYRKLIEDELGEELAQAYGLLSASIHPSLNDLYKCDWDESANLILSLLYKEFGNLPETHYSLTVDCTSTNATVSSAFINLMKQERKVLDNIADVFRKSFSYNNYVSNTLTTIGNILPALAVDRQLGLTEQIKCKWKILIEHCAVLYFLYFKFFGQNERYALLKLHSEIQLQRNLNSAINFDDAYNVYGKIYKTRCDKEVFEQNFIRQLGYMIDDKGDVPSLKKIVKQFIDLLKTQTTGVSLNRIMFLDYIECQMISHANGYMWFANAGAFKDVKNIFIGLDMALMAILDGFLRVFQNHRAVENSQIYKPVINILRNSKARLKSIYSKKQQILEMASVEKWHVYQ